VTAHLVATLGLYGAVVVIGYVAGMFPLVSIEAFLVGYCALETVTWPQVIAMVLLASLGHQLAKTTCWAAGIGALEHGRVKPLLERWRPRIERWNRHPNWVFFFAATIGLPPMWLIGFIAKPIMQMRFWPFTLAGYGLRACRYAVLAIIPILAK
jgi:membrane protein YqaA with SNARE-associated domain